MAAGGDLTLFRWLTERVLAHTAVSIVALALTILTVGGGLAWFQADFNLEAFYGRSDPAVQTLRAYLDRWGEDDMLVVVVDAGDEGLFSRSRLQALDTLAQRLEEIEGVGDVLAPTRVPRVRRGFGGQYIPVPMVGTVPPDDADEARKTAWRDDLLADPTMVPTFLSEDGRYAAMLLGLTVNNNELAAVGPVVRRVEEMLDPSPVEGMRFLVGGIPAIRADILGVIVRDQLLMGPIAAVLMGGLLALLFRSRHGVLIPGVAAGVPAFMLLGVMGWTGEPFGLLNQVFLALVPAIAVADAVHLVSRYHEEADALGGASKDMDVAIRDEAIVRAMSYMGLACFLTSFTTIVGFLSLLTTDMGVIRNFGLYAAVGVGLAYFTVLFIVPLTLLSTRSGARHLDHDDEGTIGTLLRWAWHAAVRHPVAVVGGAVAVLLGCAVLAWNVESDWKVTETFNADHPVSIANAILDEQLGGVLAMELELSGPPGTFENPEVLQAMYTAEREASASDTVRTTASLASISASTSRLIGGPLEVPSEAGVLRRVMQLADRTGQLSRFVDEDRSITRVLLRTQDLGASVLIDRAAHAKEAFEEALSQWDIDVVVTGSSLVASRGVGGVTIDLRDSLLGAFGIVALIIAVLFRKVRYGLLSILPNVLPLGVALGAMALMGWTLEPGAAVVFTISVGISVDSAIHVFARFDEARAGGAGVDEALQDAVFHSGRAILITTLILIVGFAVNVGSSAPATAAFGRIGTTITAGALIANLLVLPALLKLTTKDGPVGSAASDPESA